MANEVIKQHPQDMATATNGFEQLPEWLIGIRKSMAQAMAPDKLKAVFDKQVELAMNGDVKAARFVFEQAARFSEVKGVTLVQNVYHNTFAGGPDPAKPTDAVPGSPEKLEVMRRRIANGQPLTSRRDREHVDLS